MNHAAKLLRIVSSAQTKRNLYPAFKIFTRSSSITTWNKDWKPGPYPRTKEERIAAARKYNLIPEDYEPYPEEEGYGDYPMFMPVHMENRDSFEPYDFVSLKRNYGEPVHPDIDICYEDRVNFQKKYKWPLWKIYLAYISGVSLYVLVVLYDLSHPVNHRMVPKQYPYSGEKYYTFEPAE